MEIEFSVMHVNTFEQELNTVAFRCDMLYNPFVLFVNRF